MLGKSGEELEALLGDDLEYTPTTSGDIVRLGIEDPAQQLDRATKRLQQETARIDLELKRIQTEADGNIEERTGMDGKSLGPMSSYAYGQYLNRQKVIAQTMVDLSQVNDPKWKRADINGLNNNLMKGIMPYGSKAGFTQLPDGTIITTAQASTLDNALGIIAQATGAELFKENKGTSKGGILDLLASSVDPKQVFQEAARLYRDGNQTITDAIDNNKDVQTIFNKRLGANWKEGAVGPAKPNPKEDKDGETTEEVDTRTEKEQAEQAENTAVGGVDGTTVDPAKAQEIARAEEIEAEDRKNAQKAEALQNKAFDIAAGQSPDKPIALRLNEYLTRLHKQKGFEWVPRDRSGRAKLVDAYISDSNIESFAETDADRLNQAFKIIARR